MVGLHKNKFVSKNTNLHENFVSLGTREKILQFRQPKDFAIYMVIK
jgi:hypothetical protein